MKPFPVSLTLAGLFLLGACTKPAPVALAPVKQPLPPLPDPLVSGKRLSQWVEQLEDRDPEVLRQALAAIVKTPSEEAKRAKEPLRQLTQRRLPSGIVAADALVRYELFNEVDLQAYDTLWEALESGDEKLAWKASKLIEQYPEHAEETADRTLNLLVGPAGKTWRTAFLNPLLNKFGEAVSLSKLEALPEPEDLLAQIWIKDRLTVLREEKIAIEKREMANKIREMPREMANKRQQEEEELAAGKTAGKVIPEWEKNGRDWRTICERAASTANAWRHRALELYVRVNDISHLPEVTWDPMEPPPPTTTDYQAWFEHTLAYGKAWQARAEVLEGRWKKQPR